MANSAQFKSHSYGANMDNVCVEQEAVKMVVEMLLGLCNDLFTHFDQPLEKLFSPGKAIHRGKINVDVFRITQYGLHVHMKGLSSALVKGVLNWFAHFGSHIYVCRKFAHAFANVNAKHHLTSAVLDSFKSVLTNLLTAVEESLCAFESQVLGIETADRNCLLQYKPKLTLISLYQQCLRLAPLFRSLAGIVGSVVTVMATVQEQDQEPYSSSNALPTILEKLLVRGIMQDISEVIKLGRLVDIQPVQAARNSGTQESAACSPLDLRPRQVFDKLEGARFAEQSARAAPTVVASPERTPEVSLTQPGEPVEPVELSLKLQLATHTQSELHQFSKLFLTAMAEQYLTNLTTAVWQQPSSTSTARGTVAPAPQQLSSSVTSLHCDAGGGRFVNDSRVVDQGIESLLSTHAKSAKNSTRQTTRKQLTLLRRIGSLISSDVSYEVPRFLACITTEAMVSSGDIQILQKSRIQRQNQSYNLSRLKGLVQASAEECRTAIISEYHNCTATAASASSSNSAHLADPIYSYLHTGRSVKVVGVLTPKVVPAYRQHRPEKIDEARQAADAAIAHATKVKAQEERVVHEQTSLTLKSYQAGGLSSNAHYHSNLTTAGSITTADGVTSHDKDSRTMDVSVNTPEMQVTRLRLSRLLTYTPTDTAMELPLLSSLREQLHQARIDCAAYVRTSHYLRDNLRFLRDVFFLGQPDLYAPIRELCLSMTDWSTYSEKSIAKQGFTNKASDVAFIGESIHSAILEKAPRSGVRHVAVQIAAEASAHRNVETQTGAAASPHKDLSAGSTADQLRNALSTMRTDAGFVTTEAHIRGTEQRSGVVDETTLLSMIAILNVDLLHQWPLTYFVDAAQLRSLNSSLRFLVLITASRWAAEYWWMDVISNDSLSTASSCNPKTGAWFAGSTATQRTMSAQDLYLSDVLQAKRNARAGLGIWLHCVTSLNNIFMAHIHRTQWPAFEEALTAHEDSMLQMKADLQEVLADADASLLLLRAHILEVVVLGFAAAHALRDAIICEQAELSVVVEHNNALRAAEVKKAPRKTKEASKETAPMKGKDTPKPWKTNAAGLTRASSTQSMNSVVSETDTVGGLYENNNNNSSKYRTSAAVLIVYRAAEDAFAALKTAVSGLKAEVSGAVRSRLAMGRVDREGKALEELLMALS